MMGENIMTKCLEMVVDNLLKRFEKKNDGGLRKCSTLNSSAIIEHEMNDCLRTIKDLKMLKKQYAKVKAKKEQAITNSAIETLKLTVVAMIVSTISTLCAFSSINEHIVTYSTQLKVVEIIGIFVVLVSILVYLIVKCVKLSKKSDNYVYNLSYLEHILADRIEEYEISGK